MMSIRAEVAAALDEYCEGGFKEQDILDLYCHWDGAEFVVRSRHGDFHLMYPGGFVMPEIQECEAPAGMFTKIGYMGEKV